MKRKKYIIDPEFSDLFLDDNTKQIESKQSKKPYKSTLKKNDEKIQKEKELLLNKYPNLNPCAIGQIVRKQTTLEKELQRAKVKRAKEKRKKKTINKIKKLMTKYPLMLEKTARKIALKQITIEDYLFSIEQKKEKKLTHIKNLRNIT